MARIASRDEPKRREFAESLGKRIARCRFQVQAGMEKRVSQQDFGGFIAKQLGLHAHFTGATVSRWEAGESVPDLLVLSAIAEVAAADPGWLAYGAESSARDFPRVPLFDIHPSYNHPKGIFFEQRACVQRLADAWKRYETEVRAAHSLPRDAELQAPSGELVREAAELQRMLDLQRAGAGRVALGPGKGDHDLPSPRKL
jgi:transcriptional regulator with XRE-family HTH domain